jgi:hypothetical protein
VSGLHLQLLYVAIFGISLGTISYRSSAQERGWSSMTSFENPKSALMMTAVGGLIASVSLTAYFLVWWQVLVTIVGGYILMIVMLSVLRQAFWLPALLLFLMVPYAIAIARPN